MNSSLYINNSRLWRTSLGDDSKWPYEELKKKLVVAFDKFRDNTSILAEEISHDLPDFTVHNISHIDSLWEVASSITGEMCSINPVEAFVLGGAILIHDLGMASVAYVDGVECLRKGMEWNDALEFEFRRYLNRTPTESERKKPPLDVIKNATESRLRVLHAIQAEKIPELKWTTKERISYRLLEDSELLDHFGETIGRIAASHWWAIERVSDELDTRIGAPPSYPYEWDVDVLKLACILRVADAANIDSRRADGLRRALHKRNENSELHWIFQNHIARPIVQNNQLIYNSVKKFSENEIDAWWLGYETLEMIDRELHNVDVLLKESGRQPFDVNGVRNIENPRRLCHQIQVNGWEPLDAIIHISNVPKLVKSLGGEALYGKNLSIPLRELIQNSCDAIEARRKMERLPPDWGKIVIRIGKDDDGRDWIEVEDNGIGMSQRVLSEKLLDFGTSFWGSDMMIEEHKGLLSSGFNPTGKFGIGFFSVFMLSENVVVSSRSIYSGSDGTYSLLFGGGLTKRPILKKCKSGQGMNESGTKVRIFTDTKKLLQEIITIFKGYKEKVPENLEERLAYICYKIAPSLNANLSIQVLKKPEKRIIIANDWKEMDPISFLLRLRGHDKYLTPHDKEYIERCAILVKPLYDSNGNLLGRAFLDPAKSMGYRSSKHTFNLNINGIVTCGGLFMCTLNQIVGILCGGVDGASRNIGKPIVDNGRIAKWASEQAILINENFKDTDPEVLCSISSIIHVLGGDTGNLPICETATGWSNYNDVKDTVWPNEVGLIQDASKSLAGVKILSHNVISADVGMPGVLNLDHGHIQWPNTDDDNFDSYTLAGLVTKALSESWKTNINKVREVSHFIDDENDGIEWVVGVDKNNKKVKEKIEIIRNPCSINH